MVMESRRKTIEAEVEHRHVPILNGKYNHLYPRGGPKTNMSLRMPDPLLENIDYLAEIYGLHRWAVISIAISQFIDQHNL